MPGPPFAAQAETVLDCKPVVAGGSVRNASGSAIAGWWVYGSGCRFPWLGRVPWR
jgi:hypothetical protein